MNVLDICFEPVKKTRDGYIGSVDDFYQSECGKSNGRYILSAGRRDYSELTAHQERCNRCVFIHH